MTLARDEIMADFAELSQLVTAEQMQVAGTSITGETSFAIDTNAQDALDAFVLSDTRNVHASSLPRSIRPYQKKMKKKGIYLHLFEILSTGAVLIIHSHAKDFPSMRSLREGYLASMRAH